MSEEAIYRLREDFFQRDNDKELRIAKIERDLELLELKFDKMNGDVIETRSLASKTHELASENALILGKVKALMYALLAVAGGDTVFQAMETLKVTLP